MSGHNHLSLLDNMNAQLTKLGDWFAANKLTVNPTKTYAMLLSRKKIINRAQPLNFYGSNITWKSEQSFLGVPIDDRLNWKAHTMALKLKLSRQCGILYKVRDRLSLQVLRLVYYSLIYPHLLYCNIIWSSTYQSHLQPLTILQKKF